MNAKSLIGGLLAGAALGVAIGILLAPESGSKTRENIAKGSRKLVDGLKGSVQDSVDSLRKKFGSAEEVVKTARENSNSAFEKMKV